MKPSIKASLFCGLLLRAIKVLSTDLSVVKGNFSLGYPCVNSAQMSDFPNPSPPYAANLTHRQFCDDLKIIFAKYRHNSLNATNNKRLLFGLVKSNLTHNNGPFLDTSSLLEGRQFYGYHYSCRFLHY